MNSGTETPNIPKTVKKLSVSEPLLRALMVPKITPNMEDKINAEIESSKWRVIGLKLYL